MVPEGLRIMSCFQDANCYRGSLCCHLILFFIWLPTFQDVTAQETHVDPRRISSLLELAKEPTSGESGLFDPIEISPAVIPKYPYPTEPLPPMYPTFPTRITGYAAINYVLLLLVKVFQKLPSPYYLSICQCLMFLDEPEGVISILEKLLRSEDKDDTLLAFQIAFDLVENEHQAFLLNVRDRLSSPKSQPAESAQPQPSDTGSPPNAEWTR